VKRIRIHEHHTPGKRLGRHIHHDPRSLEFGAPMAARIVTTRHLRRIAPFDQGDTGSCTGNAGAGLMCTSPFGKEDLDESDAIALYSDATKIDDVDGSYPPDDTGSSGLAVCKVLKARGWISSYSHAFGLDHALRALVLRPGIVGIGWREGCDSPDANGVVEYTGELRGGHEIEAVGLNAEARLVWLCNSWGEEWGAKGYFALSFDDFGEALADHGDVMFAHPVGL
jgi:hypothetical protein